MSLRKPKKLDMVVQEKSGTQRGRKLQKLQKLQRLQMKYAVNVVWAWIKTACVVIVVAALMMKFDQWLARRTNGVGKIGLDADAVMILARLLMLNLLLFLVMPCGHLIWSKAERAGCQLELAKLKQQRRMKVVRKFGMAVDQKDSSAGKMADKFEQWQEKEEQTDDESRTRQVDGSGQKK